LRLELLAAADVAEYRGGCWAESLGQQPSLGASSPSNACIGEPIVCSCSTANMRHAAALISTTSFFGFVDSDRARCCGDDRDTRILDFSPTFAHNSKLGTRGLALSTKQVHGLSAFQALLNFKWVARHEG
jgi:hypothetical protein